MVPSQEGVRPGARATKDVVVEDDWSFQHRVLLPVGLQPFVGSGPDALLVGDLAEAVVRAAAGAVALVLRTLGLGAEVGDLGQRTVSAVLAVEQRLLGSVLGEVEQRLGRARATLEGGVELARDGKQRSLRVEDGRVSQAARAVGDRYP